MTAYTVSRLTHMTEVTAEFEQDAYDLKITEQAFKCDNCGRMNMLARMQPSRCSQGLGKVGR